MKLLITLLAVLPLCAQTPSLRGTVTDPSGAVVSGAQVQLRGAGREWRTRTGASGEFSFTSLPTSTYQVRITAKGFTAAERRNFEIIQPQILNTQLAIHGEAQVITVLDEQRSVNAAP